MWHNCRMVGTKLASSMKKPLAGKYVGTHTHAPKAKEFSFKRENLIMLDVGLGTLARDPEGMAFLHKRGINISSTADKEAADPEIAGFFPAILQGDVTRAREILEVLKSRGCPDPANQFLDASGDAALVGGIQKGHVGIVRLLLEYGGNPNSICQMPFMRDDNLTYFTMALLTYDLTNNSEEIVNALIDGGADVHALSGKGTPLSAAVQIQSDHAARMRICKKILEKRADPNQYIVSGGNSSLVLSGVLSQPSKHSQSEQLELAQLLLDYGADPGAMIKLELRGESCNAIHIVVSRRNDEALKLMLSSEKGKAAVNLKRFERCNYPRENNGNGETALTMCCGNSELETYRENRVMAVELLRVGADPDIEDHIGLSASVWLRDRNTDPNKPHAKKKELYELVQKAKDEGPEFWDSDEVKRFIDEGETNDERCDNCGTWADAEFLNRGRRTKFQRCARCKRVYCELLHCC